MTAWDFDVALLAQLLDAPEGVSEAALSARRTSDDLPLAQALQTLEAHGCVLQRLAAPGGWVWRLESAGLSTWSDYLRWALDRQRPQQRTIEVFQRTGSTQDALRRVVEARGLEADGALVIANEQEAGRGRLGRRWQMAPGSGLLFSRARVLAQRGRDATPLVNELSLQWAVAGALAVEACCPGLAVQIKWPNDLLVDGRKFAGVLVESFSFGSSAAPAAGLALLVGMGLNVAAAPGPSAHLTRPATCLHEAGYRPERLRLLTALNQQLDAMQQAPDPQAWLTAWRQRSVLLDQLIEVRCDGREVRGRVVDLDPHEGLVLRTELGALVHLPAATSTII